MKNLLALLLFTCSIFAQAQSQLPHHELLKEGRVQWVDNQLVVRFVDQMNVQFGRNNRLGIPNLDALLEQYNLITAKQLFPIQKQIPGGASGFTTYTGQYVQYPKLTNIYVLTFDTVFPGTSIFQLTDALQQHTEHIVYAEPNYKFEMDTNPADTLYQYQYNTSQMNVDSVWAVMQDSGVTDSDIVIAIIDTGVDTTHADLSGKQYFNMLEVNGLPGVDDDNNGFIDDVSGWDFVNLDNHAADDNSHGTHCAGIAVAKHNTIGIAGISKGAKYMPIKGLESSGGSAASVLAQGVVYAANNGADILSMSFGGYGRSLALENALAYAYAFSLPVGAAGNDGLCIRNDGFPCPDGRWPAPLYPGAYTFVLAAQATQQNPGWNGYRVWFSNYDFDGPTYTDYPDEFNYEVYAPGTYIVSSIPGGGYANFSGTSMACPAVAGSAAMYMAFRPNNNKEKLFIDYIMSWYDIQGTFTKNQGGQFPSVDLVKAIWPDERPVIWNKGVTVIDSIQGDGDYKLDAGEVVQLRTDLKNLGSSTDSVFVGLRVSQYEDPTVINLIDSVSFIGSLSSYASGSNNTNMFELSVNSNVVNGRNISLNVYAWTPRGDTVSQDFVLEAQAGCEYNGVYAGKTVLSPSCDVIITGNTAFDTLIILPGTRIQIDPGVGFGYHYLTANGKPDSMILFTKNINSFGTWQEIKNFNSNKSATFRYCIFEYGGRTGSIGGDDIIGPPGKVNLEDCVVRYCHAWYGIGWNILNPRDSAYIRRSNFFYNLSNLAVVNLDSYNWYGDFTNNNVSGNIYVQYYGEQPAVRFASNNDLNRIRNNSFFKHGYQNYNSNSRSTGYVLGVRDGNGGSHQFSTYSANYIDSNYYGTTNNALIEANIFDFQEYSSFPIVQGSVKKLLQPKKSNHGHVFKVYLDSVDVNIFDNPIHHVIGLGKHSVKVVFNRPMNVSVTPFVTYGVRQPFTQNIIQDSAFWSADSMIWTSNFNVTQLTSSDGYNRISIRNAFDNEYFEVPIEDYRFEFRLNVAGALSTGFNAIGDSSEIRLNWSRPDSIIDLLGYNIYRIDTTADANGDGRFGDTVLINTSLVMDTNYVDENVVGGVFYRYHYTALRSSLTESQMSVGVWCTPYAAAPRVRTKKALQAAMGSMTFDSDIDANFIATTGRFQFGTSKSNLSNTTQWSSVGSDYAYVPFQASIQSVQPGIVYYYRAQGQNSLGLRSGAIDSILTKSIPQIQVTGPTLPCVGATIAPIVSVASPDTTLVLTYQVNNGPVLSSLPTHIVANTSPIVFTVNATGLYTQATSQSVTITPLSASNAPVSLVVSGATTFCQGGSVTLSVPTGVSSVSWSNGQTGNSLVVNTSGTYSATYMTNNGCTVTSNPVTVTVNPIPQPVISSSSGQFVFCAGSSLVLNATSGAIGYQWFRNGIVVAGATSSNVTALLPGTYTVQTTSSSGCVGLSAAVQVQEIALPSASISTSATSPVCVGDTVTLTAPSGFSYLWSNGATTQSIETWTSGAFTVQVTNSNGCSNTSGAAQVSFNPIPAMSISSSGPLTICPNSSVTLTAAPGFANYVWNNGATTQSIIVTSSGSYSATGFTASGCQATSAATAVTVNTSPVATVTASGTTTLCQGDSVVLSAPAGYSYAWSNGATTQSITVTQAGNYTVQVTNASGCQATSAATAVTVNALPVATITASGSTTLCAGDQVTLTAPAGYSYAWSNGATTQSITVTQAGNYTVQVTNASGCQATSNTTAVTVNALPVATITASGSTTLCAGDQVTLTAPAGYSYAWSNGATTQSITVTQAGNYTVQVTNASGCQATSAAMAVTVSALPVATITANGTTTLCAGAQVTLSAPAGMSYLWSNGATTQSITVTQAGNYTVQVTNASGCQATSAATAVTVNALPVATITASGSTTLCAGDQVTLTAPAGYSYAWSNGATTQSITVTQAGNYTVQVTNTSGCQATSAATAVTVNALPVATITASGSTTLCAGDQVTLTAPAGYSYAWSNGATTQSITVTQAGNYTVQVTNASGCQATSNTTAVTVNALPVATITASGSTTLCAGDQVTLTAPAGYSYAWSNGATTQSITVTQAGNYTVQVTNASGCQATSAATAVTVNALPVATITANGPTAFCPGDSVQLSASVPQGTILWNTGATASSIWVSAAGSYSVTVTDNGCSATSNAVLVSLLPQPTTPTVYYSNNANLLISSAPQGNQWILNGTDIPGADSTTWYPTQNGLYAVRVTNASGCTSESDVFNYVNIGTGEAVLKAVSIYPNPTTGMATIELPEADALIRVYDGIGRLVLEGQTSDTKYLVDLTRFASGVYRVSVQWQDGTETISLIKN